jgi:hypothetical protein
MNMKNIFLKLSLLFTIATFSYSCSKKIDEAYANPNADVKVPVEQLLPQIVSAMAGNYAGHGTMNDARFAGAYIQNYAYFTTLSNFDKMGYTNTDVAQSTWRIHYYDIGQNCMRMIEWGTEDKKWDYVGVGKAIFAWSWLTLTDYHGEVILKEAFNTNLVTFKYDTEIEVYDYVRQLCFEALENLNKTGDNVSATNLAKGDAYFYNGDVNKWKKFVYGVLARYYNHQSNKSSYKPDSVIYYCNLSINDNADNAMVKFAYPATSSLTAAGNFYGPARNNIGSSTSTVSPAAIRQGAYIANLMNGDNTVFTSILDPRAWYMLRGNNGGTIVGVQPNKGQAALTVATVPENFWGVTQVSGTTIPGNNTPPATDANCRFIFRNAAPFPIMTATEIKFMKAEAAWRKAQGSQAAYDAYKEGISVDFDMLSTQFNVNIPVGKEITAANKAAYMNDVKVVPATASGLGLNRIMLQKYIAMFGYGVLETWVDMRRYHYIDPVPGGTIQVYTDFVPPSGTDLFADNGTKLVYRMRPRFNSEYVWNILELQRIGATQLDYHTKRTFVAEP